MSDTSNIFHVFPKKAKRRSEEPDIETAVTQALSSTGALDASYVFVTADGAEVTLAGWVHTRREIATAIDIACSVSGVSAVRNELSLD
ncbi:BON domain-containing protein [Sinorhizobium sp. 7-81]|uniref:BON domain-containing protein n=1 Tax=Sinorhizobium sp. 8-89 TaxID=3049089 RepID=UPI0024C29446|nr:BON domain-containing protein [Sinorhizobium sp. 8-89]MDK1490363.1 BON domain-containing protein [Sinorhizobium sp. 8-89]